MSWLSLSHSLSRALQQAFEVIFVASAVFSVVIFLTVREVFKPPHRRKRRKGGYWSLPPGPPGIPIFGNLLQYRRARRDEIESLEFLSSLSQYGEMTTLQMGSKTWVLLNSDRVVNEIIAKRGNITHERPYMPIASELVSRGNRFLLQQTSRWIEARRVTHHLLSGSSLGLYGEWQEVESLQLLAAYLYKPHHWYTHHYRYCVSVMHRIILGERLLKSSQELADLRRVTTEFLLCINATLVDFFPQLDRLPQSLQPWRRHYSNMGRSHCDSFQTWWNPVKESIANGTAPPSFVRDALLHSDTKYKGTKEEAMYLAMSTISAGSDNPRMTMNSFVMAALSYPEALQRARKEVDDVCGCNAAKLPGIDDMTVMPYVCALIKEVLRWRPTVPMIPQHQLTQDLDFEGFLFPAGTEFIINGISVGKDFKDPDVFRPERWLDGNERNIIHGLWHFGGGRRICVGYRVGQMELFLAFARLVYCFDYAASGSYDNLRLRHSTVNEPFPVRVTVRSAEHERLIVQEASRFGILESAKAGF